MLETSLPVEVNALWGRDRHNLELGLGYTPFLRSRIDQPTLPGQRQISSFASSYFSRIGYRYQRPEGGLFFRAAIMPNLFHPRGHNFKYLSLLGGGISIGKSF